MKNAALVLFFALALGLVFYGGLKTAEKLREPVINEVKVTVEQRATTAAELRAVASRIRAEDPAPTDAPPEAGTEAMPGDTAITNASQPGEPAGATPASRVTTAMPQPRFHLGTKEPLVVSYPKPMYVGTPVPIRLRNMEKPREPGPWQFDVPVGSVNLARGRLVTASDSAPLLGELSYITDGDKSADEGAYVELAGGRQWVQIDLGRSASIFCILVWHYHLQARAYKAVVIQISDDPAFASGVLTVFNNDIDNEHGFGAGTDHAYVENNHGRLIDTLGLRGRYVRLYSNGNTANGMNHYIEVEVYGL